MMKSLDFVSLFAGAGGLDLGLEQAGWNCKYASDIDQDAISCLRSNQARSASTIFRDTIVDEADVKNLSASDILDRIDSVRGSIPLLAGGPPCQSWSSAGHQHGLRDPRGRLFEDFVRIAHGIDSRWILFENVRGLLTARGPDGKPGSALALMRKSLFAAGFQSSVSLLNAADFGVAQRRVRLFIIGYHQGDEPPFPAPTHSKNSDTSSPDLLPWVSMHECLDRIPELTEDEIYRPRGKMAKELVDIPAGSGVKSPGKKETTRPGGHWGYKQGAFVADPNLPARTVTASGQQDWIRDKKHGLRRLSPRECAAIQSFPENWIWTGSKSSQYRLIGNAVPPLLAESLGSELLKCLLSKSQKQVTNHSSKPDSLNPLPASLEAAIIYTAKEEKRNGPSRRNADAKRNSRIELSSIDAST